MRVGETFVEHIPRVVYELWPSPFRDEEGRPLARATRPTALARGRRRGGGAGPVDGAAQPARPRRSRTSGGPEYDLDGNVVEPQPEDPWGSEAEATCPSRFRACSNGLKSS